MAKETKKDNLSYRISQIHSLKFSFKDIELDRVIRIFEEQNTLALDTNTSLDIDKEKSTVTIDISTNLIDKVEDEVLVEHSGRTVFLINGLDKVYNEDNENFDLPDSLIIQLFSLAYSHARALLATEISPTIYKDKYILPVIDPSQFLKHTE